MTCRQSLITASLTSSASLLAFRFNRLIRAAVLEQKVSNGIRRTVIKKPVKKGTGTPQSLAILDWRHHRERRIGFHHSLRVEHRNRSWALHGVFNIVIRPQPGVFLPNDYVSTPPFLRSLI